MTRMRILYLTPFVPHRRVGHGTATVASHVVEHLARRHSVEVACFTFRPEEEELAEELRRSGIPVATLPFRNTAWRRRQARLRSLATGRPYVFGYFDVPAMRGLLRSRLRERRHDLLHVDTTFLAPYVNEAPGTLRRVLVEIDVTARPLARRRARASDPLRRLWFGWQERQMRRHEPRVCSRFDRVYAVSEQDRALLREMDPSLEVGLLRYGTDPSLLEIPEGATGEGGMLFMGAFLHLPNVEGLRWFCRSVLPRVAARVPDARLTCVGGGAPRALRQEVESAGGLLLGWVPEVTPHLAEATVGLVPLRSGGGVKLKTLELMAAARAVVTTGVGCEGIDAVSGEHLLVADDAGAFADAVVRLLGDAALQRRLGRAARQLIRARHGWERNLKALEEDYMALTGGSYAAEGAA